MVVYGPLVGGLFSIVNGIVFLLVGRELWRRELKGDDALANVAFLTWWVGMGFLSIIGGLLTTGAAYGASSLAFSVAFLYVTIIGIAVALWGLTYYLLYVYTGRRLWIYPAGFFHGIYLVYLLYLVTAANPMSIDLGNWGTRIEFEREPQTFPYARPLLLVWLLPVLLAAVAYVSLLFRVRLPIQRYRVALVAGSMLVWFGSSFAASAARIATAGWWSLAGRFISLGAALLVYFAFRPPRWVTRSLKSAGGPAPEGA